MTRLKRSDIPNDFEVQPLRPGQKAEDPATCGTCGLTWDDGKITGMTPAPSARCPFEAFHAYENTTPPDTVAKDLQAVLDALRRHITSGDVAVFDDAAIPTVGNDSFLLALPTGATFRIEVRPQGASCNSAHSDEVELKWHNFYKCPRCGHEWEDDWDCQCDDDCGECGNRHISPYKSEEIKSV